MSPTPPSGTTETPCFKMNLNYILALLPAAIFGVLQFGGLALGVIALSVSTAMLWEAIINIVSRRKIPIGDLDAAVIGLLFRPDDPGHHALVGGGCRHLCCRGPWKVHLRRHRSEPLSPHPCRHCHSYDVLASVL